MVPATSKTGVVENEGEGLIMTDLSAIFRVAVSLLCFSDWSRMSVPEDEKAVDLRARPRE